MLEEVPELFQLHVGSNNYWEVRACFEVEVVVRDQVVVAASRGRGRGRGRGPLKARINEEWVRHGCGVEIDGGRV